ncbi:MAG: DUF5662 family protein [Lachnospiraceae bacterium]|nr:DUF5662 family protein [Lachnospiraceae bacterium]
MNAWKHFKTITHHKYLVMKGCFKVGLYKQGILHDMSKYSPSEFWVGIKYYQGNRSPNNAEREAIGYSSAWLHHKGRNKHHYEYWIDYSIKEISGGMAPAPMPNKYIVEMLMDRIAACKVYNGKKYTNASPWEYYSVGKEKAPIHPETKAALEKLLYMLAKNGEEATFAYIKKELLRKA